MRKNNVKLPSLVMNLIAIVVISAILIGATFAWFNDSVVSSGNKIQAGTLKVDLELLDKDGGWRSIKDDSAPIFDYDKWEPGYTDVKILKVENEGTLALQWKAKLVTNGELSELANVIDVYVLPSETELSYPEDRSLEGYTCVGTVAEFANTIESTTRGTLLAEEVAYLGIALKMRTDVGNEYQGMDLGGAIDIVIVATQISSEDDAFNNEYDKEASLSWIPVANANQLRLALANKESTIVLTDDIVIDGSFEIPYNEDGVQINGNGYAIVRENAVVFSNNATTSYTGDVFVVAENAKLTLTDVVVDGGALWVGEIDSVLKRGVENAGVVATGALITANKNAQIVLGEGAVVQNNVGAIAVNLGTRIGATLVIDGGEVLNNNSDCGAIWGGGHITLNSGKINGNSSTGLAGAIRMVSNCNFTMNSGEIKNNKATTSGGVFWGYGASTYNFNGGEISNNYAAVGGVMYTGDGSVVNVRNNFKMINNTAEQAGAMRLENRTTFNMEGGLVSGNKSTTNPDWNGFYGWNPAVNISGGVLADDVTIQGGLTPTIGGNGIAGVIHFDISTGHNTCYLKSEFGTIQFTVAEGSNFSAFNFKPDASYVYTEGDENKLICKNEGDATYYDEASNTFRIKAVN